MPSAPAGGRYGARGGNWLPELVDGQLPFGKVDGVSETCPTPVLVACLCAYPCWVVPGAVGKVCDVCREKTRAAA